MTACNPAVAAAVAGVRAVLPGVRVAGDLAAEVEEER